MMKLLTRGGNYKGTKTTIKIHSVPTHWEIKPEWNMNHLTWISTSQQVLPEHVGAATQKLVYIKLVIKHHPVTL